jgi:hypothetical protein
LASTENPKAATTPMTAPESGEDRSEWVLSSTKGAMVGPAVGALVMVFEVTNGVAVLRLL